MNQKLPVNAITLEPAATLLRQRSLLEELVEVGMRIAAASDSETVCTIALPYLLRVSGMVQCALYWVARPEQPLILMSEYSVAQPDLHPAPRTFLEGSLTWRAVTEQRTILLTDEGQRTSSPEIRDTLPCASVAVPLVARDKVLGVFYLHSSEMCPLDSFAINQIELIARQVAITLDNITLRQLEQRQRVRAELMQQISLVALSMNDTAETIEIAFQLLSSHLPFQRAFVTLDPAFIDRSLRVFEHEHPDSFRSLNDLPVAQTVIRTWAVLHISDTLECEQWLSSREQYPTTRSYVGAPLFRRDKVFGVLNFLSDNAYAFSDDDVNLVQTLANQFADILEKTQIFHRMDQRDRIADDLILMGGTLSATLDEQELLDIICEQSAAIFNIDRVYLWLFQQDRPVLASAYGDGVRIEEYSALIQFDDAFSARILKDKRPVFINQAQASPHLPEAFQRTTKAQSVLGVPFLRRSEVIAVLVLVDTLDPERFSRDDTEPLHSFGVQAGLALENAHLFAETRRRVDQLRLVNEVGRVATSISRLDSLLVNVAKPLYKEYEYEAMTLLIVSDGQFQVHTMLVRNEPVPTRLLSTVFPAETAAALALRLGEPVMHSSRTPLSVEMWARMKRDGDPKEWHELAIPLIISEEVIGILNFESGSPITGDELDVLEPLAAQVAFSVGNAQLFDLVREQIIDLDSRVASQTLAFREQKEHIEAIVQSVADGVIITDLTGQIISRNPAADALFAMTVAPNHDSGLLTKQITDLVLRLINGDHNEQTVTIELGMVAFQAKAARVRESGQDVGAVIVLRDITPLREVDKLKSQFVSTVSHELRTPLSNIKLYLKLLETGKPDKQPIYRATLVQEANRLERLITDLLDLSRLEQKPPAVYQAFNLEQLIISAVDLNRETAQARQIYLRCDTSGEPLPPAIGDPDQIAQVLMNLISNALNYTPAGGGVHITCTVLEKSVRVEVRDTGIGISEEDQTHIFDRFYRGQNIPKNNAPGTGLGLSICKEIIARHSGALGVESRIGEGSLFWFTLPLVSSSI